MAEEGDPLLPADEQPPQEEGCSCEATCFRTLGLVSLVTCAALAAVQITSIVLHLSSLAHQSIDSITGLVLRFYGTGFCLISCFVELDGFRWTRKVAAMVPWFENWFLRGFFYVFCGCLAIEMSDECVVTAPQQGLVSSAFEATTATIMEITALVMCAVGCLYLLLSCPCVRRRRNRVLDRLPGDDEQAAR
eukprot:TRINITY_DN41223_c0_g1_i1.p2 TRINITY_DN41223_c0_g1~~TRINITY_DN41223_c0_g1_i1.p2  ORF type:complete len:191 (+),score=67.66 TRINITY_DN41223_c0_g1_i1:82-654(+)